MVESTACKTLGVFYFLTVDSQKSGSKVLSKLIPTIYGSHSTDCGQVPTSPPVSAQHHAGQAGPWGRRPGTEQGAAWSHTPLLLNMLKVSFRNF